MPATEQHDGTSDDLATLLEGFGDLTHSQRRMHLGLRRLDLDVQRLDAIVQLMGTSVGALSDEVRQLGTFVQRLETKLDLNRQLNDFHLRTIMSHIGVPLRETFRFQRDSEPPDERRSPAPG